MATKDKLINLEDLKVLSDHVEGEVTDLKSDLSDLEGTLISEGTIRKVYTPVFVSENTTTTSAGKFADGTSGTNAYVFNVPAGSNIIATGGNIVGYYATLPVKGTSYTVDNSRRVEALNNTKLTVPTGANYVAISATSEPSVTADIKTTSETIEELETNMQDGFESVDSKIGAFENKLINNGTLLRQYNAVNQYSDSTVNASGYIVDSVSGANVYVFNVAAGTKIVVTGGTLYGLFATNPVKNTTQTTDQTRQLGTLNNTVITMPSEANYIAITSDAMPVVFDYGQTTSQIVDNFENEFDYINGITDAEITFENEGFINGSGTFISNTAYRATGFIPISENGSFIPISYRVKGIDATCIAFFDGQKQLIKAIPIGTTSSLEEKTGTLEYASGSVYARICTYVGSGSAAYADYYAKYGTIKNTVTGIILYPTDYQGSEISVFNKILCIGDSLTSGTFNYRIGSSVANYVEDSKYSYPTYLKKMTGCDTTNLGNGGKSSLEWYQMHTNDDLSGYDCAIIQLGVNDVGRYGTWGQNSIDGFTGIINKLKNENKNIKIFVANIIPARSYHNDAYIAMSNAIKTFITGLEDPQVILLDIQQYGHTYDSAAYNCGHLSALGYWRLAQDYKAYISWYIFMNKTDFKEVQFIGTDYVYD